MIGYICLLYIGVQIGAPWWFYLLLGLGVCIKTVAAIVNVAKDYEGR